MNHVGIADPNFDCPIDPAVGDSEQKGVGSKLQEVSQLSLTCNTHNRAAGANQTDCFLFLFPLLFRFTVQAGQKVMHTCGETGEKIGHTAQECATRLKHGTKEAATSASNVGK